MCGNHAIAAKSPQIDSYFSLFFLFLFGRKVHSFIPKISFGHQMKQQEKPQFIMVFTINKLCPFFVQQL